MLTCYGRRMVYSKSMSEKPMLLFGVWRMSFCNVDVDHGERDEMGGVEDIEVAVLLLRSNLYTLHPRKIIIRYVCISEEICDELPESGVRVVAASTLSVDEPVLNNNWRFV